MCSKGFTRFLLCSMLSIGNTTEKVKVWEQKFNVVLEEPFSITDVEVDYDIVFEVNSSQTSIES